MLEKVDVLVALKDDSGYGENLTAGILSAHPRLWDGSAYDRWPGNSTDGALVNLGSNNDVTISSGSATIGSVEVDGTALTNSQTTVDSTADEIVAASAGRQGAIITNQGSVACYIGDSNVTTSNGFLLNAGESVGLQTDTAIYGVTASSSTTIGALILG